ncbi:phosphotransferase [Paraburkholderia sp.]|uniref:phosphotransferase enzyme family protein n=1 Tax=Paraburkholderia sp. TaxID=1926495 RepID=UPI002384B393|nr:phosphotransferase [Paraburkholderia sp.]MDE1179916.1 phosphotransferase [Paraburkholderia sp.]
MSVQHGDYASDTLPLSIAPKQFGVDGVQEERDWPLMTRDELSGVLARYRRDANHSRTDAEIGPIATVSWHSPRPFSAAAIVNTVRGDVLFVKRHHVTIRDTEGLHEEHRFIAHLRSRGMPVSDVLDTFDGATAVTSGDWTYEVHALAPGVDAYRETMSWLPFSHASHAYAAGRTLARMHRAAADYAAPARTIRPLLQSFRVLGSDDFSGALERWVDAQPLMLEALGSRAWRSEIVDAIGPHHARFAPCLPSLEPLWTHGDWHASNLLWTDVAAGAQVRTILDFGLSDRTCAVYDLALAIERNAIEWMSAAENRRVHFYQIDALLTGYESLNPLSGEAYFALIALLPIVHTEFALSEVGYFAGIVKSPENADVAYDGYLLGHARWFETSAGRAVLDWLRKRDRSRR